MKRSTLSALSAQDIMILIGSSDNQITWGQYNYVHACVQVSSSSTYLIQSIIIIDKRDIQRQKVCYEEDILLASKLLM